MCVCVCVCVCVVKKALHFVVLRLCKDRQKSFSTIQSCLGENSARHVCVSAIDFVSAITFSKSRCFVTGVHDLFHVLCGVHELLFLVLCKSSL